MVRSPSTGILAPGWNAIETQSDLYPHFGQTCSGIRWWSFIFHLLFLASVKELLDIISQIEARPGLTEWMNRKQELSCLGQFTCELLHLHCDISLDSSMLVTLGGELLLEQLRRRQ